MWELQKIPPKDNGAYLDLIPRDQNHFVNDNTIWKYLVSRTAETIN